MTVMRVTTSAPGKLMLLGEHAVVYGRPCMVTAAAQRMWVTAESTQDGLVHLCASSLGVDDWIVPMAEVEAANPPVDVRFLHSVVRCLGQQHGLPHGLRVEARSEFSDKLGLGSSAAVTVAAAAALSELLGLYLSKSDLFALGFKAVGAVQGVGSGFDLAATLYGGTLYYRRQGPEIVALSHDSLLVVVGYSGTKADTVSLVHRVAKRRERQMELVEEIFDGMARLVEEGREALLALDWHRLGRAMNLAHSLLDALGVSTPKLSQLVRVAQEAGAYGAKLSGAGGGDCMIALVGESQRDEVAKAIQSAGGEVVSVQTGAPGVRKEEWAAQRP